MKVRLIFKTPDVLDQLTNTYEDEDTAERVAESLKQWIKFSEIIVVEFDVETNTATVVNVNDT